MKAVNAHLERELNDSQTHLREAKSKETGFQHVERELRNELKDKILKL
jgi:hypothetical protein